MRQAGILMATIILFSTCQRREKIQSYTEDFNYLKIDNALVPILVRGNIGNGKIILFVQGGPGANTIDMASIDYTGWQNTLESEYAIAYYDHRGTGNKLGEVKADEINMSTYIDDLHLVAKFLKKKYGTEVVFMGHSFGGQLIYRYLLEYGVEGLGDYYISVNGPVTNDKDSLRWDFRREFLVNIAQLEIANNRNVEEWAGVQNWLDKTPTIRDVEGDDPWRDKGQWNDYVDELVYSYYGESDLTLGQLYTALFRTSYNPFPAYLDGSTREELVRSLFNDINSFELSSKIEVIEQEILLITGRYDDICPPEEMSFIANRLKSSELVIIENAGHECFNHRPVEFRDIILNYLK